MWRKRRRAPQVVLTPAIILWRAAHGVITLVFLAAIAAIWWSALTGRRGRWVGPAIIAVVGEGVVVSLNHGDCPLGPLGERLGDPVPFFELLLSPKAARRAVPALAGFTTAGIALLAMRARRGGVA